MVTATSRPEKESFILVTFFYGANLATRAKYTNWDQSVSGFQSEPRMAIELPDNDGTFDRSELRITLPIDVFTQRLSSGTAHSPVYVKIEEVTQGLFTGDQNDQKVLYRGRITRSVQNYQGELGKVVLFGLALKSRLDISLGLPCNHHCAWTLFGGGCGASLASFNVVGEIDSSSGQVVTVTTPAVLAKAGADARYWKRGYLEKDGLRISVRDYDGTVDVTKLHMTRRVPTDWVAGSNDILFVAGCDKTIQVCRSRFSQEETFLGLGFAIPVYQPTFENPA